MFAQVAGTLMLVSGAAAAQGGSELQPIDRDGSLSEAELAEHVQLLLMADPRPPVPAAQGAISAAVGQLGFSLVTGGSGSSQDLARPRYEALHPDTEEARTSQ